MASVVSKLWVVQRCSIRTIMIFALIGPRYMVGHSMVGYSMVRCSMVGHSMVTRDTQFVVLHWYLSSITQRYRSIRMGGRWVVQVGYCSIMWARVGWGMMGNWGNMVDWGVVGHWGDMVGYRGGMVNRGLVGYRGRVVVDWGMVGNWAHSILIHMFDGVGMGNWGMIRSFVLGVISNVRVMNGVNFLFDNLQCWWVDFMHRVVGRMEFK